MVTSLSCSLAIKPGGLVAGEHDSATEILCKKTKGHSPTGVALLLDSLFIDSLVNLSERPASRFRAQLSQHPAGLRIPVQEQMHNADHPS